MYESMIIKHYHALLQLTHGICMRYNNMLHQHDFARILTVHVPPTFNTDHTPRRAMKRSCL